MNKLLKRQSQVQINYTLNKVQPRKMTKENQENTSQDEEQAQASTSTAKSITRSLKLDDITKSFREFNGTGNINEWIRQFNDQSNVFNLTQLEKFVFAKKLITGAAELFIKYESKAVKFDDLIKELKDEFGAKVNSAVTHEKLRSRKMTKLQQCTYTKCWP